MRAARSCAKATITEYGTAPFSADLTTSASSTGTWRAIWSRCAAHPGRQAITGRRYTRAGLGRRETSKCCRHLWRRPIATGLPSSTCSAYRNRHWVSIAINASSNQLYRSKLSRRYTPPKQLYSHKTV